MSLFYDQSPIVTLPTGNSAFGAVTSVYTTVIAWEGFELCGNVAHGGYTLGVQLYLDGVLWGPVYSIDSSMSGVFRIPLFIPKGVAISAAASFNTTGNPSGYITLAGRSTGKNILTQGFNTVTGIGTIGTAISTANTWIQLGSALPSLIIKKLLGFTMQSVVGTSNILIGFGPSSTSVETIVNLPIGTENASYIGMQYDLDVDFPGNGNYLWAQSPSVDANIQMLYFT